MEIENAEKVDIRDFFEGIKGYNWVNPLVIFLILHHFVDVAYGARRYLEQSFALDEVVETSQGGYLIVCIVASLIVGACGVLCIYGLVTRTRR